MSRLPRGLLAAYRALLRLYPSAFATQFAEEMAAVFVQLAAEAAGRGRLALVRLVLAEFGGLLRGVAREHLHLWRTTGILSRFVRALVTGASLLALVGLTALVLVLDFAVATPAVRTAAILGVSVLGAVLGLLLYQSRRSQATLVSLVLFVAVVGGIWGVDWNSRKPFLRDLDRVRPGMTVAEVDTIMARYDRLPVVLGTTSAQQTVSYRHTTAAWGNSDIGLIMLDAGRVVAVTFLPD